MIGNLRYTGTALKFMYLCFPALLKFQLKRVCADGLKHLSELVS
jgi:hypothetical protein